METTIWSNLSRKHIRGLDGMRAIAVLLVLFYHMGTPYIYGGLGVMIFFVLSGFLITWLLLKEQEKDGTISLVGFYKRRALRIFPAFYCYWCLLVLFLILKNKVVLWDHAWSSFFYFSNYYSALNGDPNNGFSHTWSLAIEEQFYMLWPLLFLFLATNIRKMMIVLPSIIICIWGYRLALLFIFKVDQAYFYTAFDTRFDALMMGCFLSVLLKKYGTNRLWQVPVERSWYLLITLILISISVYAEEILVHHRYRDVIGFALNPILICVLLIQVIGLIDKAPVKWLEYSGMKFLGKISYSLYLYQQLTVFSIQKMLDVYHPIVQGTATIFVTIALASASYYWVEKPFLKLKS